MTATLTTTAGLRRLRFLATLLLAIAFACAALLPRVAAAADVLDGNEDFKLLSELGFEQAVDGSHPQGTRTNDYMWSMAWFKGKLYVGTGRFEIDPATNVPRAGQIWRYTPGGADGRSGTWALAFEAPNLLGAAREFGYRWMTVCNFYGTEYLFVSTLGVVQGNILYTTDGVTFNATSRTGMPTGTVGFRTMACFNEAGVRPMLITTPVGRGGDAETFDPDRSDNPIVLSNSNPAANTAWRDYSQTGMGDPNNGVIFTLFSNGTYVYAGVGNEVSGGQLWRTSGCIASQPYCVPNWTKVLDRGGGRPKTASGLVKNAGFADITQFNGDLYLAMSAPALDGNLIRAELLRLRSDNTFEVLVGEPRMDAGFSRSGAPTNPAFPSNLRCGATLEDLNGAGGANDCPPTTRRGAGLGVPGNATTGYPDGPQFYFWRVFNYAYHPTQAPKGDNRLYLGTFQADLDAGGLPGLGFDMLVTSNGTQWSNVTSDGFGHLQQQGLRSIASTPYGLAVGGTHFPFTPEIAEQFPLPEIRGGNVWMGVPTTITETTPPVTTITSPPSPVEGATLATRTVTFAWSATDTPAPGSLPLTYAYRLDPLESSFSGFGSASTKTYTNLPNGTYTFHVIARDSKGNTEAVGAAPGAGNRRTFSVSAADAAPSVTITVAPASTSASSNATFVWAGSDDLTPAGSLTYKRWLSPLESDPGVFTAGTSKIYSGLADGPYTFHVIAKDGADNTSTEATHSFTVAVPPGPPASPGPATIALVATRTFRIGWTDVAGETRYEVERCVSGRACAYVSVASNVPANAASYDDLVPAAGLYAYRVRACNGTGCSAWAATTALRAP